MYKPHTNSDRKRYVEEVGLEGPLYFHSEGGCCGISLADALHSRVKSLRLKDEPVFEGRGPSVSIRLEVTPLWPYAERSKLIPIYSGPDTDSGVDKYLPKISERLPALSPGQSWPKMLPNAWKGLLR